MYSKKIISKGMITNNINDQRRANLKIVSTIVDKPEPLQEGSTKMYSTAEYFGSSDLIFRKSSFFISTFRTLALNNIAPMVLNLLGSLSNA